MDVVFDTATGALTVNADDAGHWGAKVRAMVERHGQVVNLRGVEMHLTVKADADVVLDIHLPPPGVRYSKTDQDVIATTQARWGPEQFIEVDGWLKTSDGHEVTVHDEFTAPRPPQPYPSWTWDGARWVAPKPMPDDGGYYSWDEDSGEWVDYK